VTRIGVDGHKYKGVTNIGFRPTVDREAGASLSIETHCLDCNKDIYGKQVSLEFLVRLRDERRFAGVEDLVSQIKKDIVNARRYFHWLKKKNLIA